MTRPRRPTTADLIEAVFDAGTYVSWDGPPIQVAEPGSTYAAELAAAAESSGVDEAIITGEGRLHRRRVPVHGGIDRSRRRRAGDLGL
jgi:acetyl-CoA carboxylase carboxyl transferase subunit beta